MNKDSVQRHPLDDRFVVVSTAAEFVLWRDRAWREAHQVKGMVMTVPMTEEQSRIAHAFASSVKGKTHYLDIDPESPIGLRSFEFGHDIPSAIGPMLQTSFAAANAAILGLNAIDLRGDIFWPIEFHCHDDAVVAPLDGKGPMIRRADQTIWTADTGEIILLGSTIWHKAPNKKDCPHRACLVMDAR